MYKKIDIYSNGDYVCSTKQRKTCKEAVENFKSKPVYQGYTKGIGICEKTIDVNKNKITAHFAE